MEFHVRSARPLPPLAVIEDALQQLDPAAVVDLDPTQGLRVNAALGEQELVALLNRLGGEVRPDEAVRQPSVCCGGCSG